jgi:hypothetical protein
MKAFSTYMPCSQKRLYVRWYEKSLALTNLLQWLKHKDVAVKEVVGDALSRLAKEYKEPCLRNANLKSYGPDIGLGLLHSQKRRRWYDKVPSLHQGMRRLYVLSPLECTHVAERVLQVRVLFDAYDSIRQEWALPLDKQLLEQLNNQCLNQGFDAAQETLIAFERRLFLTCGK